MSASNHFYNLNWEIPQLSLMSYDDSTQTKPWGDLRNPNKKASKLFEGHFYLCAKSPT